MTHTLTKIGSTRGGMAFYAFRDHKVRLCAVWLKKVVGCIPEKMDVTITKTSEKKAKEYEYYIEKLYSPWVLDNKREITNFTPEARNVLSEYFNVNKQGYYIFTIEYE